MQNQLIIQLVHQHTSEQWRFNEKVQKMGGLHPHTILFVYCSVRALFCMHLCPGTMTTQTGSINSDLQPGLDRRLRHTHLNTERNQLAIKVSADN